MRRRGLTLVELLVVVAIVVMISAGALMAMGAGLTFERRLREDAALVDRQGEFERQVQGLLQRAYLAEGDTQNQTYFIGGEVDSLSPTGLDDTANLTGTQTLVFTTIGDAPPRALIAEQELTFEELNEQYGPQGGVREVSLSVDPIAAPDGIEGLFLREQRPADGDPSQGGRERLLWDQIEEIQLEFWDGVEWLPGWDTRTQAEPRLPAAVRFAYRLVEEEEFRAIVIRCLNSDITPDNPLTQEVPDTP